MIIAIRVGGQVLQMKLEPAELQRLERVLRVIVQQHDELVQLLETGITNVPGQPGIDAQEIIDSIHDEEWPELLRMLSLAVAATDESLPASARTQ
jgi:hypothetical protein